MYKRQLIPFDVGGNPDLMDDFRYLDFQASAACRSSGRPVDRLRHPALFAEKKNPFGHFVRIEGFEKIIIRAGQQRLPLQGGIIEARHDHDLRLLRQMQSLYTLYDADGIQACLLYTSRCV